MPETLSQKLNVLASLVVGLGGSGQRVLDALKALIIERLGVSNLPLVELLAIDVMREYQRLEPGEFLRLRVRGMDRALERFSWSKDLKRYPLVRRLGNIEKGCGGIPPIGRFAFAINRQNILHTLRHKARAVTGRNAFQRANQAQADSQRRMELPVWLVASFFGGTGSGMFFDVAAHAKKLLDVRTRVYAMVFLPDCYNHVPEEDQQRGKATGYAMLRQLSHLLQGNEFATCYQEGRGIQAQGFIDQVYLVGGISESGMVLDGERGDPFRMAGEFLYDYLFTDFGAQLEAQVLNSSLTHPGAAAFGIHKIVHPVHKLGRLEKLAHALKGIQRAQISTNGNGSGEFALAEMSQEEQENLREVELK